MCRTVGLLIVLTLSVPGAAQQLHPEGFGANATGGAGGQVIRVTTLAPDGPGSLRAAIDTPGPRIVVFDVAGTIDLGTGRLAIGWPHRPAWREATQAGQAPPPCPYSDLTIDGTTAPPPGITIGGTVLIGYGASNIIIRNVRIRDNGYIGRSGSDCICIVDDCREILVDHCSLTWSRDEVANPWGACGSITFSWCIFQGYGPHGFGPLVGGGATDTTIHHCLFAHNMGRNPRVSGPDRPNLDLPPDAECLVDIRNNVMYNWFNVSATEIALRSAVNLIGNRYLPGLSSNPRMPIAITANSVAYVAGNLSPVRPTDDLDQWLGAGHLAPPDWQAVYGPWEEGLRADQPFEVPPVATQDAQTASDLVLALAGAWPRDPIDAGIIRTVLHGTGWAGVPNTRPIDYENRPPTVTARATGEGVEITLAAEGEDGDGRIVGWAWELGDGAVALGEEITHRYQPGEYVAAAVAMDELGANGVSRLKLTVRAGEPVVAELLPEIAGERLAPPGPTIGEPPVTVSV
ncbi:MAG: PKD domain-containing protein, partial [Armatimonadota bacterium]